MRLDCQGAGCQRARHAWLIASAGAGAESMLWDGCTRDGCTRDGCTWDALHAHMGNSGCLAEGAHVYVCMCVRVVVRGGGGSWQRRASSFSSFCGAVRPPAAGPRAGQGNREVVAWHTHCPAHIGNPHGAAPAFTTSVEQGPAMQVEPKLLGVTDHSAVFASGSKVQAWHYKLRPGQVRGNARMRPWRASRLWGCWP